MVHHDNYLHVGHQGLNLMSELTGKGSISIPALMITMEISAPKMPSSDTPHSSITPAEISVASVMTASNSASTNPYSTLR